LSYGGARAQEVFYRIIQVARDRLGGAHCCGTCALYNREALSSIGGFVQMGHSEDAHTGFGLTSAGWRIRYVPVIASIGASPNDAHAFFHQQHRWCMGNLIMMVSSKFWKAEIPFRIKFCYMTGFLFYLHQPFLLLQPFQLFWILFYYNAHMNLMDGLPYYPHIAWALVYMFTFYIAPFRWGYLYALLMRSFAYAHAAFTVLLGHSVGWIPTNAKHAGVSMAFRQTYWGVSVFFVLNILLIALSLSHNRFQLFDPNFLTVQFWVIYNAVLIGLLLWQLYKTIENAQKLQYEMALRDNPFDYSLEKWQYKTVVLFTILLSLTFFVIAYKAFDIFHLW
jgi:cellulose synthase (UDP-forming)